MRNVIASPTRLDPWPGGRHDRPGVSAAGVPPPHSLIRRIADPEDQTRASVRAEEPAVIHVLVEHASERERILHVLHGSGHQARGYTNAETFLADAALAGSGCLVVDQALCSLSGVEVQRVLRAQGSRLAAILLGDRVDVTLAITAMRAGFRDLIEKPWTDQALLDSVGTALARSAPPPDEVGFAWARSAVAALSRRERDVLDGLVAGLSNKIIARRLGISHRTVENHRARLMERLGVSSISGVVRTAIAAGILRMTPGVPRIRTPMPEGPPRIEE
jgi:two-component system response regulator FixJ